MLAWRGSLPDSRIRNFALYILEKRAPLPGGDVLLTERSSGLRVVSADGKISTSIAGTPRVHDDARIPEDNPYVGEDRLLRGRELPRLAARPSSGFARGQ